MWIFACIGFVFFTLVEYAFILLHIRSKEGPITTGGGIGQSRRVSLAAVEENAAVADWDVDDEGLATLPTAKASWTENYPFESAAVGRRGRSAASAKNNNNNDRSKRTKVAKVRPSADAFKKDAEGVKGRTALCFRNFTYRQLDAIALVLFPLCFFIFNVVYWQRYL